jgi:hypothetical protein
MLVVAGSWSSVVKLVNTTMVFNKGRQGAALALLGSTATIDGCNFRGNSASASGGAVAAWESRLTVTGSIFEVNYATAWLGMESDQGVRQLGYGGACVFLASNVTMHSCTFDGNKALEGGAVWVGRPRPDKRDIPRHGVTTAHDTLRMRSTIFVENAAAMGGAMVANYPAEVWMDNVTFSANNAGMAALEGSSVLFEVLKLSQLYHGVGGAISIYKAKVQVYGSRLESNSAVLDGGERSNDCCQTYKTWAHGAADSLINQESC